MDIINMAKLSEVQLLEAAQLLTDSLPLGWATLAEAREEITERLIPENTLLAAVKDGTVIGWGGILPQYDGNVQELHPLAVREDQRGKGVGTAIVRALEDAARAKGGLTMWLGADDERPGGETSLANVDLYDNYLEKLRTFDPGTHQSAFYLKMGYQLIGAVPDADGPGKPDLYFAKRL